MKYKIYCYISTVFILINFNIFAQPIKIKYEQTENNKRNTIMDKNLKALQLLDQAIELDPYNIMARHNKALILMELNKHKEAIHELTEAIKIYPEFTRAYYLSGLCYLQLENFEKVKENFIKFLKLDQVNGDAYFYLSIAQYNLGEIEHSYNSINNSIQILPTFTYAIFHRARLAFITGKIQQAKKDLDLIQKIDNKFLDNLSGFNKEVAMMIKSNINLDKNEEVSTIKKKNKEKIDKSKSRKKAILEIIAIVGALASIISLIALAILPDKKVAEIPSGDSINFGNVEQTKSAFVSGSNNIVQLNINDEINYKPSIVVTRHYRYSIEFSLSSSSGNYEVLQLYVEVKNFFKSTMRMIAPEGIGFKNQYDLILIPNIRYYPLVPLTPNNNQDTWIFKGKDVELFVVNFSWPMLTSVDILIKADLYDHQNKKDEYVSTEVIHIDRIGEQRTGEPFEPNSESLLFSPFLYKLYIASDHKQLIVSTIDSKRMDILYNAFNEISSFFSTDQTGMIGFLKENREESIFLSKVHPQIAKRLFEIAKDLYKKIESDNSNS